MLVRREVAQQSIPFEPLLVHDHWIALIASTLGTIESIKEPLIQYRQHSANQTGVLSGVYDKKSYFEKRIIFFREIAEHLENYGCFSEQKDILKIRLLWLEHRKLYFLQHKLSSLRIVWKYKYLCFDEVLLETLLPFIPNFLFRLILRLAKGGVL